MRRGENLCMSNGRFMARQALHKSVVVFCNPKHSCFVNWKDLLIKLNGGCFSSNPIQQLHPCLKAEARMLLFPNSVHIWKQLFGFIHLPGCVKIRAGFFCLCLAWKKIYLNVSLS